MNDKHRDEWLMAQVARGRAQQLEPLVRRYASPLLTFLRRMVGDPLSSEELFQDTFVAVWVKRRQYRFPRPFKPWLYAIAVNKVRALFRTRTRRPVADLDDDGPEASESSPAELVIRTETAELVTRAVRRLPPQQRQVVVLRVWNGLSYAEIGEILGRTEATVRSNMHHALAALRQHLEPHVS